MTYGSNRTSRTQSSIGYGERFGRKWAIPSKGSAFRWGAIWPRQKQSRSSKFSGVRRCIALRMLEGADAGGAERGIGLALAFGGFPFLGNPLAFGQGIEVLAAEAALSCGPIPGFGERGLGVGAESHPVVFSAQREAVMRHYFGL